AKSYSRTSWRWIDAMCIVPPFAPPVRHAASALHLLLTPASCVHSSSRARRCQWAAVGLFDRLRLALVGLGGAASGAASRTTSSPDYLCYDEGASAPGLPRLR